MVKQTVDPPRVAETPRVHILPPTDAMANLFLKPFPNGGWTISSFDDGSNNVSMLGAFSNTTDMLAALRHGLPE